MFTNSGYSPKIIHVGVVKKYKWRENNEDKDDNNINYKFFYSRNDAFKYKGHK